MAAILRGAGLDPGPKRGEGTWADFVARHAATLWACDFLSVRTQTPAGTVDLYLLFFLHVGTRRVVVSGPTTRPNAAWVAQQARNATMRMEEMGLPATLLLRDRDTKFVAGFDAVFRAGGVRVKPVGPAAPNLNAYAERFVQTLRTECLDHFLVCGEKHLRHLVRGSSPITTRRGRTRAGGTCRSPRPMRRTPGNRRSCHSRRARCGAGSSSAGC